MKANDGLVVLATGEMTFDATGDPDPVTIPEPYTGFKCKRFILRQKTTETQVGYRVYAPSISDDPWEYYPAETHTFSVPRGVEHFVAGDIPGYIASLSGSITMVWRAEG